MASKRNLRRKQCRDKRRYDGVDDPTGLYHVEKLSEENRSEYELYPCPRCGGAHVGHKGGSNSIANVAKIEFGFNRGKRKMRQAR